MLPPMLEILKPVPGNLRVNDSKAPLVQRFLRRLESLGTQRPLRTLLVFLPRPWFWCRAYS